MKISICIPQYNRIEYLKINLQQIALQESVDLEVIVSDDASTDNTAQEIKQMQENYPFPLIYHRFETNHGYDRNLRNSMELASGQYCFILGNDDTLSDPLALSRLVKFLIENNEPEVGFCNCADFVNPEEIQIRAKANEVIGSGPEITLKYYSSFSFVAGLVYKKTAFDSVNTDKLDGSIYVQIYLAALIILQKGRLFTYYDPIVLKDIRVNNDIANSYRDTLPRKASEYKVLDAGLPSYANVCATAFADAGFKDQQFVYKIIKRIYLFTYPFWLFDYRNLDAKIAAKGLTQGLKLSKFKIAERLSTWNKFKLKSIYQFATFCGLYIPYSWFETLKNQLYKIAKS